MNNQQSRSIIRGSTSANTLATQYRWEGFQAKLGGLNFPREYDGWPAPRQRAYERGRQQAAIVLALKPDAGPWRRSEKFSTYLLRTVGVFGRADVAEETNLQRTLG